MQQPRFDFSGAHVLVTGGTSGIGLGIATAFRAAGADVTVTGTRGSAEDYDADLHGMRYLRLDLEDDAAIDAVAAACPALDVLVNNGGANFVAEDEHQPQVFEKALRVNLSSAFRMSQRCHGALAASRLPGGASIIGIASMTSYFGMDILPGYGSAKTGLLGLTRSLAAAWGKEGIRVNAVAAGLVRSRMTGAMFAMDGATDGMLARTPLGRLGEPADIASAVLFLCSPAAAWITGQTLAVDGGYSISG